MENTNNDHKELMGDTNRTSTHATNTPMQKANEVAQEMKDEVGKYADTAKEYWDEFTNGVRAKSEIAREGVTKAKKYADDMAHENPWKLIGIAAIVGAVAGLVLSSCNRKKGCRHDHE